MGIADYAAVLGVWIVGVIAPGPDVVLVLRESLRHGRTAGTAAALGVVGGIIVWIVLAMVGAQALVKADDRVLGTLEIVGGTYLVYLGLGALRAARQERSGSVLDGAAATTTGPARTPPAAFRLGVFTNLSNPKALVFFGTVFSVLVPPSASTVDHVAVLVLLTVIAVLWFGGLARFASSERAARVLGERAALLDGLAGLAFTALGAVSVAAGIASIAG